jgi:hypothetical protein
MQLAMPYDIPPLHTMAKQIPAPCYNSVRLALLRFGKPLRITLTWHRGLEIALHDDVWWCLDSLATDLPIMAWQHFQVRGRNNLSSPVDCELSLYHHCAGLVMGTTLSDLQQAIDARLAADAHAARGG